MNQETPRLLKEMPKRCPTNGTFELTVRCNLHCKMCLFRRADSENAELMASELTTEQWIDMARQVAAAGTIQLLVTGGEPMLRPDFCEIWEGIYRQGFLITLYTNATLVTPKIMETLRKYPPHKIGVTIYGASAETYGKVCGNSKAFEQAIAGMHHLQTLPSLMEFRTTIIKDNVADLDAIEKMVNEEFHCPNSLITARIVNKAVRGGCADVVSCRLSPEENVKVSFFRAINRIKSVVGDAYDERNLEIIEQDLTAMERKNVGLLGCDAGMCEYVIAWDGKLLGCQMLDAFSTDAVKLGFAKAWADFPLTVKVPDLSPCCRSCNHSKVCNCCYAVRYAETGNIGGCPEYVCQDANYVYFLLRKES